MYKSMADLLRENAELTATNQQMGTELAAIKLAFIALNINPQTLGPNWPDFWARFQTLRPLAKECGVAGLFDAVFCSLSSDALDTLQEHLQSVDSPAAIALENAAYEMSHWVDESRKVSATVYKLRRNLDDAQKALANVREVQP